jgi:hypothetical protein
MWAPIMAPSHCDCCIGCITIGPGIPKGRFICGDINGFPTLAATEDDEFVSREDVIGIADDIEDDIADDIEDDIEDGIDVIDAADPVDLVDADAEVNAELDAAAEVNAEETAEDVNADFSAVDVDDDAK